MDDSIGVEKIRHPAKFAKGFIEITRKILNTEFAISLSQEQKLGRKVITVLDPFAGVGNILELEYDPRYGDLWKRKNPSNAKPISDTVTPECVFTVIAVEIESEWANQHVRINNKDSIKWMKSWGMELREWEWGVHSAVSTKHSNPYGIDAIVTSPCYGNRMADKLINDGTRRNTYANVLGRNLSEGNSGSLQWGDKYREFHTEAWRLAVELLNPGGLFILNIKDHIRNGVHQYVSEWHKNTLEDLGMEYDHHVMIPVRGLQQGQNAEVRVPYEWVILFRKPS